MSSLLYWAAQAYPEDIHKEEFEASLRRAFVDAKMDSVCLDGQSGRFLWATAGYALKMGWFAEPSETGSDYEQYTGYVFRLTDKGKSHFGLVKA